MSSEQNHTASSVPNAQNDPNAFPCFYCFTPFVSGSSFPISHNASVCARCAKKHTPYIHSPNRANREPKKRYIAVMLCLLLGVFGFHRIYLEDYRVGLRFFFVSIFSAALLFVPFIRVLSGIVLIGTLFSSLSDLSSLVGGKYLDAYGIFIV